MTSPRVPMAIGALAILTLALVACGSPRQPAVQGSTPVSDGPSGSGAATASPTPPDPSPSPTPAPIESGGWPFPPDCISYNPGNVDVVQQGSAYLVKAGSTTLLTFRDEYEADTGATLARTYTKLCFIGRDTEPAANVVTYWLDPSGSPASYESSEAYSCDSHNPNDLSVSPNSPSGWRVRAGSTTIYTFVTEDAALRASVMLSHYELHCLISWDHLPHTGEYIHEFHDFPGLDL